MFSNNRSSYAQIGSLKVTGDPCTVFFTEAIPEGGSRENTWGPCVSFGTATLMTVARDTSVNRLRMWRGFTLQATTSFDPIGNWSAPYGIALDSESQNSGDRINGTNALRARWSDVLVGFSGSWSNAPWPLNVSGPSRPAYAMADCGSRCFDGWDTRS